MGKADRLRADAARNIDAVLQTGARLLAEDPGASMTAIAAQAGVDRRTVYRHFECREDLVDAVYQAALDGANQVMDEARLESAPVLVALHRLAEGLVTVIRHYPVDPVRVRGDEELSSRVLAHRARLAAFFRRAGEAGLIRTDFPELVAVELFFRTVGILARECRDIEPGPAADIVIDTLLHGLSPR